MLARAGDKNGKLMRMKLAETTDSGYFGKIWQKAYLHLKESGLLALKGEEAHPVAEEETAGNRSD